MFQFSSLRTKLVLAFLGVALLPLLLLALVHLTTSERVLQQNANQALLAAARQTAFGLDAFFKQGLDAVRVESQLPGMAKYLKLPPERRANSFEENEVIGLIRALMRRDAVNVLSFSLLDRQGMTVLDTNAPDLHKSRRDRDYFQQPLRSGLPYVSPIRLPHDGDSSDKSPCLYFSNPVRDANGDAIGVLVVRYNATVVQQLVIQNDDLAGAQSFAIVLDEYHIRVGHGVSGNLLFKPIVPLPFEKVQALQAELRLPKRAIEELSTDLPVLEAGLSQSACDANDPCPPIYITTPLVTTEGQISRVVATRLQSQPWFVLFAQPQHVFLAPVVAEVQTTIGLGLVIAIAVTGAAIVIGRWLTNPLLHLSHRVSQFTSGNMAARANITSRDEIGMLAANFNTMAHQVGKLLQGLEERTDELEASQCVTVAVSELSKVILDSDRLLQEAVNLVQERFCVDSVQIFLWDEADDQLVTRASAGRTARQRQQIRQISLDDTSLVAIAAQGRQLQATGNLQAVAQTHHRSGFRPASEASIPLMSRGSLLGILDVQDEQGFRFSSTDLDTLSMLAGQIAIALENAQLFSELQKTEERFRTIFEEAPIGIAMAEIDSGRLLQVNKTLCQMLEYTEAELLRLSFRNLTPPEDLQRDLHQLQALIAGNLDSYQSEKRFLKKNYEPIWVNVTVTLLHDAEGNTCYSLGMVENISERKRAESALRRSEAQYRDKAQELQKALYDLQQTQAQLVQSEKMSSLGQMVAGVAHEINNPINFIYANLTYANQYQADLSRLLHLYQTSYPNPTPEIAEQAEAIDLDFLTEDFSRILSSMKVGADRVRQIVLSLRNFSRLDEAAMKPVNIHEGIESTLVILQNQLKEQPDRPAIQVIKDYGALPKVECYAGQLNQVFMNLLTNAIDALSACTGSVSSKARSPKPCIWIRTQALEDGQIAIRIIDNGIGMSGIVKGKLFDPFFTTKEVGKGTGLGLSVSYQIVVEKHRGQLHCISEPGKGAEFVIHIPVRQQVASVTAV